MGRPRKPTIQLERAGSFKTHPSRSLARQREPQPSGPLGDPPASFSADQVLIWRELETIAPADVLTNADRWLVEIVCRLMARVRAGEFMKGMEYSLIFNCLGRMGLTPADRSKVAVPPPPRQEEVDPFAELAADVQRPADLSN